MVSPRPTAGATLALVHSPLTGPEVWAPLVAELQHTGVTCVVPVLHDDDADPAPFWQQHARSVAAQLGSAAEDGPLVLAGHSGAGPLLPAIRAALGKPVAGYLFIDAGIPRDGLSRLDLLRHELPQAADGLATLLRGGARWPAWTDADLAPLVPDDERRRALVTGLRPRGERFFTEPLPVFTGWPDAPCGFLRFAPGYEVPAAEARQRGWAYRELAAGHFHMLVSPEEVATALIALLGELGVAAR